MRKEMISQDNDTLTRGIEKYKIGDGIFELPLAQETKINKPKTVLVISGASACGKDTVAEALGTGFKMLKTCTSREIRPQEVGNDPYHRLSKKDFREAVDNDEFLEHVEYDGQFYGTKKSSVDDILNCGEIPVFRVDPTGAKNIVEMKRGGEELFSDCRVVYVFLTAPSKTSILRRLIGRDVMNRGGEELFMARNKAKKRWNKAKGDLEHMDEAHYVVVNDEVEKAVENIKSIILKY